MNGDPLGIAPYAVTKHGAVAFAELFELPPDHGDEKRDREQHPQATQ